jgi:hypothetical protein
LASLRTILYGEAEYGKREYYFLIAANKMAHDFVFLSNQAHRGSH